jgi:TPR repeat protein
MICLLAGLISITITLPALAAPSPFKSPADKTLYHLAEQNDAEAQFLIGRKYYTGKDIQKDTNEAIKWLELAATQKHTKAQFQLGKIYFYGESGIRPNYLYALSYLKGAAKNNYAEAQFELGNFYLMGKTENVNYPEAIKWYRAAAEQQHVRAMVELGKILNEGRGGINPQPDQARQYLSLAAESGNAEAMEYLRDMAKLGSAGLRNSASITEFHTKLNDASAGHIPSQYEVGMAYLKGHGVEADTKLAAKWLRRAAMNDHAEAQYQLSQLYRDGVGIEKNRRRALEWLKIAASAGVWEAQKELRSMHLSGSSMAGFEDLDEQIAENAPSPQAASQPVEESTSSELGSEQDVATANLPEHTTEVSTLHEDSLATKTSEQNSQSQSSQADEILDLYSLDLHPTDAEQQYQLAHRYLTGKNIFQDTSRAAYWFEQAARQNHFRAQYELGEMYKHGKGVTASVAKAKYWLSSAASAGLNEAAVSLRDLDDVPISQPDNVVKTNMAVTHTEQGVKNTSLTTSDLQNDGVISPPSLLPEEPDQPEQDNIELQANTGMISTMGKGATTTNDVDSAIQKLIKAANNNDADAQLKLAEMYYNGKGVDRDLEAAAQWFKKSAVAGEAEAQFELGNMYKQGTGVEKNNALAIKWYRKAANQGHKAAKRRLGGCRIC